MISAGTCDESPVVTLTLSEPPFCPGQQPVSAADLTGGSMPAVPSQNLCFIFNHSDHNLIK